MIPFSSMTNNVPWESLRCHFWQHWGETFVFSLEQYLVSAVVNLGLFGIRQHGFFYTPFCHDNWLVSPKCSLYCRRSISPQAFPPYSWIITKFFHFFMDMFLLFHSDYWLSRFLYLCPVIKKESIWSHNNCSKKPSDRVFVFIRLYRSLAEHQWQEEQWWQHLYALEVA